MKKRLLAGVLAVMMSFTMMPGNLMEKAGAKKEVKAAVTLQNPRIEEDASMTAGQKVTYDCVWFGSYPQTEIVDQAGLCGSYGKVWGKDEDYEENESLYTLLSDSSTVWDKNGDTVLDDGTKYRRIKESDATYNKSASEVFYSWNNSETYHYFRYEPIRWRILNISDNKAFLLSDRILDTQQFNSTWTDVSWRSSTIRSWLNGYGSSINSSSIDYTDNNFINAAFTNTEKNAIVSTYLDNMTTGPYSATLGGGNTTDKVFLLSCYDLYNSDSSSSYGFINKDDQNDEARRFKSTIYAKAMGTYNCTLPLGVGLSYWYLRSPGNSSSSVAYVHFTGSFNTSGMTADTEFYGILPALYLNTSSDLYSYAGTSCTNGTSNVIKPGSESISPDDPTTEPGPVKQKNQIITASSKTVPINNGVFTLGAKTSGNGKLTYKSTNPKVATISSAGKITVKGYGITTISITAAETSTYKKATKSVTITVVPKKMKLKSVKSPGKGKLQAKWVKDKAASGYQIQFSRDMNFKKGVYQKTISKKLATLKKPVTGLDRKKKYYVRIRAYKSISGKKLYGIWSYGKVIKIK